MWRNCRKPVDSLGPAGVTVRADEDGFDNLDDYFSQEFENKATIGEENVMKMGEGMEKIEEDEEATGTADVDFVVSQPMRKSLVTNGTVSLFLRCILN